MHRQWYKSLIFVVGFYYLAIGRWRDRVAPLVRGRARRYLFGVINRLPFGEALCLCLSQQ